MPLNLGPVKPHVQEAAEFISRRFGISHIGGWRAFSDTPNSDHPKGLAIDVMTGDTSPGGKGDQVAAWALGQPSVTYVIWNRKIFDRRKSSGVISAGEDYDGRSPHTDHVHISFAPTGTVDPNARGESRNAETSIIGGLTSWAEGVGIAIAAFVGGVVLIGIALRRMVK